MQTIRPLFYRKRSSEWGSALWRNTIFLVQETKTIMIYSTNCFSHLFFSPYPCRVNVQQCPLEINNTKRSVALTTLSSCEGVRKYHKARRKVEQSTHRCAYVLYTFLSLVENFSRFHIQEKHNASWFLLSKSAAKLQLFFILANYF